MTFLRKANGVTLVELVIVIGIIAFASTIATISFRSWVIKYNVEAQTREIYNDLNRARSNAFQQKKIHSVIFQPSGYVMKTYSSQSEPTAAGQTVLRKTGLKYGLTMKSGAALNADISDYGPTYDIRGYDALGNFTLIVNPYDAGSAVNCIVISKSRVNLGRINGATCEFR
ncbi:hypothetical protein OR1_00120 [Geobacter sp. OR-1]|uniref:pilus assembly FimT family protein n=1 Tax=Geobacter sp. OR-1 TaxID=1266765 RepID=UPI000541B6EE|nr:prepilin-type N-terminal cleavage/methylation domain-containing protein [Geobacter sp. OR-1]GAM07851.1 hypothetical protein OR1_00120 [Geobacter sp. OR-1]